MTMLPTINNLELVIREQVLPRNHQWHTPYMNKLAGSHGRAYVQKLKQIEFVLASHHISSCVDRHKCSSLVA